MESALTKALAAKGYSRKPDGSLVRSSAARQLRHRHDQQHHLIHDSCLGGSGH